MVPRDASLWLGSGGYNLSRMGMLGSGWLPGVQVWHQKQVRNNEQR